MKIIPQLLRLDCITLTGATPEQIAQAEAESDVTFPADYKEVLSWSDGCSCAVGDYNLSLWSTHEIHQFNIAYKITHYLPGVLGIGSDGGTSAIGLNYVANPSDPPYIMVPFGDLDMASVTDLGASFREMLEKLQAL